MNPTHYVNNILTTPMWYYYTQYNYVFYNMKAELVGHSPQAYVFNVSVLFTAGITLKRQSLARCSEESGDWALAGDIGIQPLLPPSFRCPPIWSGQLYLWYVPHHNAFIHSRPQCIRSKWLRAETANTEPQLTFSLHNYLRHSVIIMKSWLNNLSN